MYHVIHLTCYINDVLSTLCQNYSTFAVQKVIMGATMSQNRPLMRLEIHYINLRGRSRRYERTIAALYVLYHVFPVNCKLLLYKLEGTGELLIHYALYVI